MSRPQIQPPTLNDFPRNPVKGVGPMTGSPGEVAETLRPEPADILIVDDTPANLRLLSSLLSNQGYRVRKAISGKMAQLALDRLLPDLILLDVRMPEMNGYELCQILKQNPKTQAIPVIFLSALGEPLNKVQAFQAGGVDYITKPFDSEEVLMRIRTHLMLQAAQRQIKQINGILEERVQERTQQLEAANFQLRKLAHYDCLTGLPNRTQFMDLLRQAQRQLAQKVMNFTLGTVTAEETATLECYSSPLVDLAVPAGHQFVVFFLDCDRFKIINDSLGHLAGDELLTLVAQRLLNTLRSQDVLARLGGDEFAILLSSIANMDEVTIVANRIIKAMEQPFQLQNHEVFIGISIGIVQVTDRYDQPEEILRDADMAMYEAKHRGKGCYHVFSSSMHESALHRLCQENDLRRAIDHNELVMFYQPIVDLKTCKMTGFEALVRWQHPQHGMVPPIEFIAMAEEMGLIVPMGWWIFEQACGQLRQWQDQGITRDLTLNLNLSAYQLRYPHLLERIDQAIKSVAINPIFLKLEITESSFIEDDRTISILHDLKDRGFQLALDDFGTGYSSLSYLHSLPIDILKIDKSFIQEMTEQSNKQGLVTAILGIAKTLNMDVVAEGIETQEQLEKLQALGCDLGQGYWFARPLAAEMASQLLQNPPSWIKQQDWVPA